MQKTNIIFIAFQRQVLRSFGPNVCSYANDCMEQEAADDLKPVVATWNAAASVP